jgi:hypothetical protein
MTPPFVGAIGPMGRYHIFDCAVRKIARGSEMIRSLAA